MIIGALATIIGAAMIGASAGPTLGYRVLAVAGVFVLVCGGATVLQV